MSIRITFALVLAAAVVPPSAAHAPVTTLSEILANPDRFDGQVVTIEGTVTNPWSDDLLVSAGPRALG